MRDLQDLGNSSQPRRSGLAIAAVPALVLAILAGLAWVLVRYVPNGVPLIISRGPPQTYVGLLTIPKGGWDYALFDSKTLLIENERLADLGQQKVLITCVTPDRSRTALDKELSGSVADQDGVRALWIEFTAEPYTSNGTCQQRYSSQPGRRTGALGRYLRIMAFQRVRQIPCWHMRFVMLNRRCQRGDAAYE